MLETYLNEIYTNLSLLEELELLLNPMQPLSENKEYYYEY